MHVYAMYVVAILVLAFAGERSCIHLAGLKPWMNPCVVEVESEDEFIVVENHSALQFWTLIIRHIFRLRFKQRQFAFLGIHLRDNTSKQVREALKNLNFR